MSHVGGDACGRLLVRAARVSAQTRHALATIMHRTEKGERAVGRQQVVYESSALHADAAAAGMPTKEEIEAAKAEVAAAVAKGLPIEMTNANTAAILDCTSNIFVKVRNAGVVCYDVTDISPPSLTPSLTFVHTPVPFAFNSSQPHGAAIASECSLTG